MTLVNLDFARREMIRTQLRGRGICDLRVLAAMQEVPREAFVPEPYQQQAYEDRPLPIGFGQTISQPFTVAFMSEQLLLQGAEKVLEIGTGSGYQTAVLARLAREVYSIERVRELSGSAARVLEQLGVTNAHLRVGDGSNGWPEAAPFDAILAAAASPTPPQPLLDQLAEGGRFVIPVGGESDQELMRYTRHGQEFEEESLGPFRFVPLIGEHGWRLN